MITVSVFGASGYSGAELLRILSSRDDVAVRHASANTSAGRRVAELYPSLDRICDLTYESADAALDDPVDVAFVALPSGEAMNLVPRLRKSARRIIDLGGDFRLRDAGLYKQYYGHQHTSPELLRESVYGLPELYKSEIASADLVANPGCYPTSIILALAPALSKGIVSPGGIFISSLSGISGAGRSAAVELSFSELHDNIRAYKVGNHQHLPEIQSILGRITDRSVSVSFVPHLVPLRRGIYTTIHANLQRSISEEEVREIYRDFYRDDYFVRMKNDLPQLQGVVHTNFCDIGVRVPAQSQQLILFSAIDNLLKGAAGQAVQNMNLMFGWDEGEGLQ